jgi:quinol monooxygenase YgiN
MGGARYTSGNWQVSPGNEQEFVKRWTEFTQWSLDNAGGARSFVLIQEDSNPTHFLSFGAWEDAAAVDNWRATPEFAQKLGACRELCSEFQPGDYSLASEVS